MTVVIGCDSFLALRNVRNGNIGDHLRDKGVVALVDPQQYEGSAAIAPEGVQVRPLIQFDPHKDKRLFPLMNRAYVARKAYYDPATMWEKMRTSSHKHHPKSTLKRTLSLIRSRLEFHGYQLAGLLGRAQAWRREFAAALSEHPIMEQYRQLLTELEAEVVVAFSLEGPREMALIEAARKMGLPTVVMIRSRDNLAAKIQHLPDADAYCVWAEQTRDFLLHLYPEIPADKVHITGSPQFDHHLDPQYRLSREAFFAQIGLDPVRPLVVYTCATPELIGHEIEITQHLADAVRDGKLAKDAQLLVRGHPRGFGSNYPLLKQTYPGVAVYPPPTDSPYKSGKHEAEIVKLILEDEPMHLATLAYQDVQVNVSGTMIVDSAIVDKPVVAVYYDIPANVLEGLSAKRFYKRSDMQALIKMGGFRLAHSPDECIALINRSLAEPTVDSDGRARIRKQEIDRLDGKAGERLADVMRGVMQSFTPPPNPLPVNKEGEKEFPSPNPSPLRREGNTKLSEIKTLDERWLEFARRTEGVFGAFPHMIPIRQAVFKSLVEKHDRLSLKDQAKQWAKLALKRDESQGELTPADVVFWLDLSREVLVDAVLPVIKAVQAAGLKTALIASPSVYKQIDPALKPILFQVPYKWQSSGKWRRGWDALRDVLPQDLAAESASAFCDMGYDSDNAVAEIKRLFSTIKPRLLVLPADHFLPGSAACLAARDMKIDSLVLLHGAVSPYNAPLTADKMGVWGAVSKDQMRMMGVPAEKLVVLGSPRHDTFPQTMPGDVKKRFGAALGLRDLPTAVFFSNGNDIRRNSREAVEGCAAWLNEAANQLHEQMNFVVRLHPNEDGSLYKDMPHLRVFKHESDLATTLSAADVCAALCSTTLVDALLYHKPVLQLYADGWPDLADNWRRDLSKRVSNAGELTAFLKAGLADRAVWSALADAQAAKIDKVFAHHGSAQAAVAGYIVEQIKPLPPAPSPYTERGREKAGAYTDAPLQKASMSGEGEKNLTPNPSPYDGEGSSEVVSPVVSHDGEGE